VFYVVIMEYVELLKRGDYGKLGGFYNFPQEESKDYNCFNGLLLRFLGVRKWD
jgi:hypothetical protein